MLPTIPPTYPVLSLTVILPRLTQLSIYDSPEEPWLTFPTIPPAAYAAVFVEP